MLRSVHCWDRNLSSSHCKWHFRSCAPESEVQHHLCCALCFVNLSFCPLEKHASYFLQFLLFFFTDIQKMGKVEFNLLENECWSEWNCLLFHLYSYNFFDENMAVGLFWLNHFHCLCFFPWRIHMNIIGLKCIKSTSLWFCKFLFYFW